MVWTGWSDVDRGTAVALYIGLLRPVCRYNDFIAHERRPDGTVFQRSAVCKLGIRQDSIVDGAVLASNFTLSSSACPNLSMYVCPQDLLVRLSCRPQQTKNRVHYRLPVTPRLAGYHMDSVTSAYCPGVTQYIFSL